MNVFEMVVIIVALGILGRVITEFVRSKRAAGNVQKDTLDDALDRIDDLEERIRVLERVVTDDGYDLKRQIDKLKD